jgi:hypothetical protein
MFTVGLLQSIVAQNTQENSSFSMFRKEPPAIIKTMIDILKKSVYMNASGSALLSLTDLKTLVAAWQEDNAVFTAYLEKILHLPEAIALLNALKANNLLNDTNLALFASVDTGEKTGERTEENGNRLDFFTQCTQPNFGIDGTTYSFMLQYLDNYKPLEQIVYFLRNKRMFSLANLQKLVPSINIVGPAVAHRMFKERNSNEDKIIAYLFKHPERAQWFVNFCNQASHVLSDYSRSERLFNLLDTFDIADEASFKNLSCTDLLFLVCPPSASRSYLSSMQMNDDTLPADILKFIMAHLKDWETWKHTVKFLRYADMLTVENLNKAEPIIAYINEEVFKLLNELSASIKPYVFTLLLKFPQRALVILKSLNRLGAHYARSGAGLMMYCDRFEDKSLSYLTSDQIVFIGSLPKEVAQFAMERIDHYPAWSSIIQFLRSANIASLANLQAVGDEKRDVIASGIEGYGLPQDETLAQRIFDLIVQNPGISKDIVEFFVNKNVQAQRQCLDLINESNNQVAFALAYLSDNRAWLLKAPQDVQKFIMQRVDKHMQWTGIVKYLQACNILSVVNLTAAQNNLEALSKINFPDATISANPSQEQSIFNAVVNNPENGQMIIDHVKSLKKEHAAFVAGLMNEYKVFEKDSLAALDNNYAGILKNVSKDAEAFIMTRLANPKWSIIVKYLFRSKILTLQNLQTREADLDLFAKAMSENAPAVEANNAQAAFTFIVEHPQDEQALVSYMLIEWLGEESREFIVNNPHNAAQVYQCARVLNATQRAEYLANVLESQDDLDKLKHLATSLTIADMLIKDEEILRLIFNFPGPIASILSSLKTKDAAFAQHLPSYFSLLYIHRNYLENIKSALEISPVNPKVSGYFHMILTHAANAVELSKGLAILSADQSTSHADVALTQKFPDNATTVASAIVAAKKIPGNDVARSMLLIERHPSHALKLMNGLQKIISYLQNGSNVDRTQMVTYLEENPEHAESIGIAYVRLRNSGIDHQNSLALIARHPAGSKSTSAGIVAVRNRANDQLNCMPLFDLSFAIENMPLSTNAEYKKLVGDRISITEIIAELTIFNCSFANFLLGKIYATNEFDLYDYDTSRRFYKKVSKESPWYYMANRCLFDLLLNHSADLQNAEQYDDLTQLKEEIQLVVNILRADNQEGEVLENIVTFEASGIFRPNNNDALVDRPISSTEVRESTRSIGTQYASNPLYGWHRIISPKTGNNASSSSSSVNNNNNSNVVRERYVKND